MLSIAGFMFVVASIVWVGFEFYPCFVMGAFLVSSLFQLCNRLEMVLALLCSSGCLFKFLVFSSFATVLKWSLLCYVVLDVFSSF